MNSSLLRAGRVFHVCLILFPVLTTACAKGTTDPSSQTETIGSFLSGATIADTQVAATTRSGAPPASGGGPTATVTSPSPAAGGGLNLVSIQGSAPFQTIFLSIGAAESSSAPPPSILPNWALRSVGLLEATLSAAVIQTSGYLQIDLPAPVTSASVVLSYTSSLPGRFDLQVQIASAGGASGPVAAMPKALQTGNGVIELVGVVYGNFGPNPANPTGPGLYGPLLQGATVSTSLDSRTAVTDANGAFDLVTDTTNAIGRCFRVTITAGGYPTYSSQGWIGSNKESGGVRFTLNPPQPPDLRSCS